MVKYRPAFDIDPAAGTQDAGVDEDRTLLFRSSVTVDIWVRDGSEAYQKIPKDLKTKFCRKSEERWRSLEESESYSWGSQDGLILADPKQC